MKNEKLLNAIGEIDDELISNAVKDTGKKINWIKWGSLAAMLIFCIGIGLFQSGVLKTDSPDTEIPDIDKTNSSLSDTDIANANISNTDILGNDIESPESQDSIPSDNYIVASSIVILDVNPSIALTVNTEEKIVSAEGMNEDGNIVLDEMDLTGVDMTVAVNAIIGSMLQKGYLSDLQNAILVSVENTDAEKSAALQERISSIISNALQDGNLDGSVLSQTVTDTDYLKQISEDYQISLGKAALIQEVMAQDSTLTVEKLAPLSITEIALISQSKNIASETLTQSGAASDKAYISRQAALESAYQHAGVSEEETFGLKVEFDSEHGIMVYEIEFRVGTVEYEYDIDAITGQIVKYEAENTGTATQTGNSTQQSSENQPPAGAQQSSGQYIGEEAAKKAALTNAGISPDTMQYIDAWLEYDDGHPEHYEVEFTVDSVLYKYEIDLYTGAVLEKEMENPGDHDWYDHDHHDDDENSENHNSHHNDTGFDNAIGEEAAKNAALAHAGFGESQVTKLEVEFDYDDGIAVYEIEFKYNEYEYEYKIDAATGAILEYEIDD